LIAFAEDIGPAEGFARKHGYEIDPNRELVGLGAANLGAGLVQGFPLGSSLSRSAANDAAGARTQLSGLVAAGLTAVTALFLTPLFRSLPEATLGAIVVVAISGMVRARELRRLFTVRRADFVLALAALVGVLVFDVLPGLLGAVALSFLLLAYRASRPDLSVLGRLPGRDELVDMQRERDSRPVPGLLIVRPNEGLFFANAAPLRERLLALAGASDPPPRAVLLDLEMSNELDAPGADALAELHEELERRGIGLLLSRVHAQVRETLDRGGVTARIGEEHLYRRSAAAVRDFAATGDDGRAPGKG
jgi:MFS superfamily sulfate permease-like transporter